MNFSWQQDALQLPGKTQILARILEEVKNSDVALLLLEAVERHYQTTFIDISVSSLHVEGKIGSGFILAWKELDAQVTGYFKFERNFQPMSYMMIHRESPGQSLRFTMTWSVSRIEYLRELIFHVGQSGLVAWLTTNPRLRIYSEGNIDDGTPSQYNPGHVILMKDFEHSLDSIFLIFLYVLKSNLMRLSL